jgi:hypothetical protein
MLVIQLVCTYQEGDCGDFSEKVQGTIPGLQIKH